VREESKVRLLTTADIEAVLALQRPEGWNQSERDWRRLLQLEPSGCFGAEVDRHLIATVTTTTYGGLAWIGMMLVAPEHRRRGIGKQLIVTALDHLHAAGIPVIKLDATPAGRPLYEMLGFVGEGLIERWEAVANKTAAEWNRSLPAETRKQIFAFDRSVFGADRGHLLDALIEDSAVTPQVLMTTKGRLQGYAFARRGLAASYVGPIIAEDEATALELLDRMLSQLHGEKVYLDFHPGCGANRGTLIAREFVKQRDLLRMHYGSRQVTPTSTLVFAIAGPEIG
jgi:GNAT superfamily N-acetyltransferase